MRERIVRVLRSMGLLARSPIAEQLSQIGSVHDAIPVEVGDYFCNRNGEVEEWIFKAAPPEVREGLRPFKIPRFTQTLSEWFNLLIERGFQVEAVREPRPSDEAVRRWPGLQDAQVVAYYLHIRVRK